MPQTQPPTTCALAACTNAGQSAHKCRRCNTPTYCSTRCMFIDTRHHRSECETLVPCTSLSPIAQVLRAYAQKHGPQLARLAFAYQGKWLLPRPISANITYPVVVLKDAAANRQHQRLHSRVAFAAMIPFDTDGFVEKFQLSSSDRNTIVKLNTDYIAITIFFLYIHPSGKDEIIFDHFPLSDDMYLGDNHRVGKGIKALRDSERVHMDM